MTQEKPIYQTFDTVTGAYDTVNPLNMAKDVYVVMPIKDHRQLVDQANLVETILRLVAEQQEKTLRESGMP